MFHQNLQYISIKNGTTIQISTYLVEKCVPFYIGSVIGGIPFTPYYLFIVTVAMLVGW
jgi:hypothetical protein